MKPATPETPIRLLKVGSCPSLSGKGKLTYHIGCTDKSEVQFRVYANTGGGFFNNDWISLNAIQQVFDKHPSSKPLTSHVLNPLFRGQSANTPGFLLAALKQEGLVQPVKDKLRCYERVDPKEFLTGIKALIKSSVDLKVEPLKAEGKAPKDKSKPVSPRKETPSKSSAKKK
jgi:hypothetical protein